MAEVVDQQQLTGATGAGFGEFAAARYRGQGFKPAYNNVTAIAFDRDKNSQGIKIFIYAGDADSIPTGGELYSWEVTNAAITGNHQKYTLPVPLTGLTPDAQYCFYIAPWNTTTHAYADDYADALWRNSDVYARGKAIVNNNGVWSVSDGGNLEMYFETYSDDGVYARRQMGALGIG